jgi:O-antigen ligase
MAHRAEPQPTKPSFASPQTVAAPRTGYATQPLPDAGAGAPAHPLATVLLCVLLSLIFYLPNYAQLRIDTGIRGLNVVNVLFILSVILLSLMPKQQTEPVPIKLPILLFFGLFTWALIVALLGDSSAWVEDVTDYKNAIFYVLLYFLFYHAVRDLRTVRLLMLMILFVMFTSSVLGVRQAFDYGIGTYSDAKRVSAPFGWSANDANRAAVFLVIYLQFVFAMIMFMKSKLWLRVACIGIAFLCVFSIFHTYSRQVYGILVVTILLIALRRHLLWALIISVLLINYDLWVPESVVQRVETTQSDPFEARSRPQEIQGFDPNATGVRFAEKQPQLAPDALVSGKYDESTESRFIIWSGALELIQSRPHGIGLNRFQREITPYVPPSHAGKDAHNFYVLITTEAGVIAPVILLILLVSLLRLGLRLTSLKSDEEAMTLGVGFTMATLAVMMGNVYGSRFVDGDVMGVYWITAALVARTYQMKQAAIKEKMKPRVSLERREDVLAAPQPSMATAVQPPTHRPRRSPTRF